MNDKELPENNTLSSDYSSVNAHNKNWGKMLTPRYRRLFLDVRIAGGGVQLKHPDKIKSNLEASIYQKIIRRERKRLIKGRLKGRRKHKMLTRWILLRKRLSSGEVIFS